MRLVKTGCFLTVFCKEFAEKRSVTRLRTDLSKAFGYWGKEICYLPGISLSEFSLNTARQILEFLTNLFFAARDFFVAFIVNSEFIQKNTCFLKDFMIY